MNIIEMFEQSVKDQAIVLRRNKVYDSLGKLDSVNRKIESGAVADEIRKLENELVLLDSGTYDINDHEIEVAEVLAGIAIAGRWKAEGRPIYEMSSEEVESEDSKEASE